MESENMKNMIVLKNLPSNMIEEAFVVLKDNVKIHKQEFVGNKREDNNILDREYIVKEAEMLVSEYAKFLEQGNYNDIKDRIIVQKKIKNLKRFNLILMIFSGLTTAGLLSNIF